MKKEAERAVYLLETVARFFDENPHAAELMFVYDAEECDGSSLAEDCRNAAATLDDAVTRQAEAEALIAKGLG